MGVTLTPEPRNGEKWTIYQSADLGEVGAMVSSKRLRDSLSASRSDFGSSR
jgi:hypothetical protein